MLYRRNRPAGPGYSRFIATSMWRAFSEPPQDWPLAICDGRSIRDDEGVPNVMVVVDQLPDEQGMLGEVIDEDTRPAAAIFRYDPAHRWWFFPDLTRDEVILLKFHDTDRTKAWRVPHTAFHNVAAPNAHVRESIEFRSIAYFD